MMAEPMTKIGGEDQGVDEQRILEYMGEIGEADPFGMLGPHARQRLVGEGDVDAPDDRARKEQAHDAERRGHRPEPPPDGCPTAGDS